LVFSEFSFKRVRGLCDDFEAVRFAVETSDKLDLASAADAEGTWRWYVRTADEPQRWALVAA
jgi:hypothetical protein